MRCSGSLKPARNDRQTKLKRYTGQGYGIFVRGRARHRVETADLHVNSACMCASEGGGLRTIAKVCESLFCPPFADFLYLEILLTFLIK